MIRARDCFPLGHGLTVPEARTAPASPLRPFGMKRAVPVEAGGSDDIADLVYDPISQTLALAETTGDPERDRLLIAAKSRTQRATDRDGQRETTPKDFDTDTD